jgi:hypothetical protein
LKIRAHKLGAVIVPHENASRDGFADAHLLPEISTRDNLESSVEKTEGSYQDEEDQVHRRTDD